MSKATTEAPAVDNYDWLQAIDDHPRTTTAHLLAAYDLLGVKTTLTDEQASDLHQELVELGFLGITHVSFGAGITVTYQFRIPEAVAA